MIIVGFLIAFEIAVLNWQIASLHAELKRFNDREEKK